jgi:hypothetical protein
MTWILVIIFAWTDVRHIDKVGPFASEASCQSAQSIIMKDQTYKNNRSHCIQIKEWPYG